MNERIMRAVVQERYGSLDDLSVREVPRPVPGPGEVLVQVRAASLHPDVWHVVAGRPRVLRLMGGGLLKPRNPIPGTDMSGVVDANGEKASRFRPGDAVFGETIAARQWSNGGAFAEYVAVEEDLLAPKPANVSFEQAASVPSSGLIALHNLRWLERMKPGQKALVNGAGGGVGSIAIQIMKSRGLHVTAVDRTSKLEMLRTLGADEVIDYKREDFTRGAVKYDFIFDVPGDRPFRAFTPVLRPGGRYVPIGHDHFGAAGRGTFGLIPHFLELMVMARFVERLRGPGTPLPPKSEVIERLRKMLADGTLTPIIDSTFDLAAIRQAFRRMIEGEPLGKVILAPGGTG